MANGGQGTVTTNGEQTGNKWEGAVSRNRPARARSSVGVGRQQRHLGRGAGAAQRRRAQPLRKRGRATLRKAGEGRGWGRSVSGGDGGERTEAGPGAGGMRSSAARDGAGAVGWGREPEGREEGAGAQQLPAWQVQRRQQAVASGSAGVVDTEANAERGPQEVLSPRAATGPCPHSPVTRTRRRRRAWTRRMAVGGRWMPGGGNAGSQDFFFAAASNFWMNLAVSFLKSLRQPLQQKWNSRPSTTAPTAFSGSSFSSETMQPERG